jgi:hypothetical protein
LKKLREGSEGSEERKGLKELKEGGEGSERRK